LIKIKKVRLQTQTKPQPGQVLFYTGTWDCAKKIVAKEVKIIGIKYLKSKDCLIYIGFYWFI
jgi:hypothetical protein